jgi:hypothetical protein
MRVARTICVLLCCSALGAQAQTAVKESTDPARADAIERHAAALKARPPQPAAGLVRARTAGGFDLLSGGMTVDDRVTMHAERERYGLWVATVAKPSGAYLADAGLRIVQLKDNAVVLERKMEGPWLMVALPEGKYEINATFMADGAEKAQAITMRASVPKKGQRQAVLRFDSPAAVAPEAQSPFKGNPFGAPAAPQ